MGPQLHDQHVLVLGLGASGLAMARWCAAQGARVTVLDNRAAPPQAAALSASVPSATLAQGAFDASWITGSDIRAVFVSPGLSPQQTAGLVDAANAQGLWVGGELSLFAHALAGLAQTQQYQPSVLAITGTNGKTTVTALTGELLRAAGKTVAVAGNIGPTLLDTLTQVLADNALPQVWVLELSSFQLHYSQDFEPTAAVVLNISQDHLDWHPDLAHYTASKARIFGPHTLMVLNRDDTAVMAMLPAPVRAKQRLVERAHVCFGLGAPQRPGDYGLESVGGMVWIVRAMEADETLKPARLGTTETPELHIQRLLPAEALHIRGRHNACNAQAALALARAAGGALGPMRFGLREYQGEPHRVQAIGSINGVEFFDDSKGTNVGATVAALQGLGEDRKLVLILGGDGKGQDFHPLAEPVRKYVRAVVLIGRDAPLIREALEGTSVALLSADSMEQAVATANAHAHAGDAVLMSPACASFDMFRDYAHRAQVFCDAVAALAQAQDTLMEVAQ